VNRFNQRRLGKSIRNAAWLVAWDEVTQSHVYRRDLDLTIERDRIAAIGSAGPADSARLQMAQRRAIEKVPAFDWAGRGAAEIMPPTFRSK
jgi:hypothetical protein